MLSVYGLPAGYSTLLHDLSAFINRSLGTEAASSPSQLYVTHGISAALAMCLTMFTRPLQTGACGGAAVEARDCVMLSAGRGAVVVEAPTYFLARKIISDASVNVESIPMTDTGMDVE